MKKNGVFNCFLNSKLVLDEDLGIFKIVQDNGNIWTTFPPAQVTSTHDSITGSVFKAYWFHVDVKYLSGDEYLFSYKTTGQEQIDSAKKWVEYAVKKDLAINEIVTLMRTREKVPMSDVSSVLAKHGLPSSGDDCRKVVEYGIAKRKVEGVLDDAQFVSKYALNREQVKYEIVSKFEVGKDGLIVLKCPSCGASIPLEGKGSSGVCKYCGSSYTVPRNILKMM